MTQRARGVLVLTCVAWLPTLARAQGPSREPHTYLKKVGFTDGELAGLEAGKAVARVVPEKDDNEASVAGVVRIHAAPEALLEGMRRIETLRNGEPVLQIGRFGTPPRVEDLRALTIEAQDLDDLRRCRVGSCDVKIPASAMELTKQVDWSAPDAKTKASQLVKEAIVRLVERYLEQGSAGLVVYNDNDVPESVAEELGKILQNSPNLMHYNPDFLRYLLDFPKATLPGVESFVFWSKERVRKPVVSVGHVCIQKLTRGADTAYFIAIKHIYDSHYFRANTEFLTLVPAETAGGFYLIHFIRARIDPPRKLRGLLLGKIKGAMKDALEENLERTKVRLESSRAK